MLGRTRVDLIIVYYLALVTVHISGKYIPIPSDSTRGLDYSYTHYLFTISRFEVLLELKNEDRSLNNIPPLEIIAENVTTATSEFLTKCMNKNLILHGAAEEAMDTLYINANAYILRRDGKLIGMKSGGQLRELRKMQKGKETHLKIIIDGHVKFRDIIIPSYLSSGNRTKNYKINQEYIEKMVRHDCLDVDLAQYLQLLKDNVRVLSSVDVNTKAYKSVIPLDVHTINGANTSESGNVVVGILLSVSLLVLVGGLYILLSRDFHLKRGTRYNEDGHVLLSDIETYSDEGDEDRSQKLHTEKIGPKNVLSEIVAVPARDDTFFGISKRKQDLVKAIAPRRYVQTASPFDVLYGAAFSHHDQSRVEDAHRPKSVIRSQFSRKCSVDTSKPLQPMVAISEEKELTKESSSQDTMGLFPQFMSKFTTLLSTQENQYNKQESNSVDDLVVYHDFPRHDGTPCVMYTPKDEVDWNYIPQTSKESQSAVQADDLEDNLSHSSLSQSSTMGSSMVAGIDNFVDKLEKLIALRSRQYQERIKMERERLERRKENEKNRRKDQIHEIDSEVINIETKRSAAFDKDKAELETKSHFAHSVINPPDVDSFPTSDLRLNFKPNQSDKIQNENNKENVKNMKEIDTKGKDNERDSEFKANTTGLAPNNRKLPLGLSSRNEEIN